MNTTWPLDAPGDDGDATLPPPWDGDIDISDQQTETTLLLLGHTQPDVMLKICRSVFIRAESRSDGQTALHALHLACSMLNNTAQHVLADQVFTVVRERARGLGLSELSTRIEFNHALQLERRGEHALAMVVRQKVLESAITLGHARLTCFALNALANSASRAGQNELVLGLCNQLGALLSSGDRVIAGLRSQSANSMAMAWHRISSARGAVGDDTGATAALTQARGLASTGYFTARNNNERIHHLETLVRILLKFDKAAEARRLFDGCVDGLASMPSDRSHLWCVLELTRLRIDTHQGRTSTQAVQRLQAAYDSLGRSNPPESDDALNELRHVLMQAQEQLGHHEQALATHKHVTQWHDKQRSASLRQRVKMLGHTVLSMRAEVTEFITHDLLTPLAAARMWVQALDGDRLQPTCVPSLRAARQLLVEAGMLSALYLDLLRVELLPQAQLQLLDLGALVDDVCESMAPVKPGQRLQRTIDIGTTVRGDAKLLESALAALLADAFVRAPAGTPVELHLQHDAARHAAVLSISHQGVGLAPATRTRLYQQSFDGEHLAADELGLTLAAKVCRLHRMRLRFATVHAKGSAACLTIKTANGATSLQ